MVATFDGNLATARDRVRFNVGDIIIDISTDPLGVALRPDEQYDAVISQTATEDLATAVMAESLAAEYGVVPDSISDDGTSLSWRDRVATWLAIAKAARSRSASVLETVSGTTGTRRMVRYDLELDRAEYLFDPFATGRPRL